MDSQCKSIYLPLKSRYEFNTVSAVFALSWQSQLSGRNKIGHISNCFKKIIRKAFEMISLWVVFKLLGIDKMSCANLNEHFEVWKDWKVSSTKAPQNLDQICIFN